MSMKCYFYGCEAEQYTFYRIPKALFTNPTYRRLSSDAKILYGLMLDRMGLSLRNQCVDVENKVFRKQLWLSRITQLEETIDSITVDSEDDNNVWGWELEEPMVQTYSLSAL